ncbi:hypothetical protein LINGRAHAP2_LOCUS33838 [Linum grandiflorum]
MDKASSTKVIFLVVLLIFAAGATSNIGAEASRVDDVVQSPPEFGCTPQTCKPPCACFDLNCRCPSP